MSISLTEDWAERVWDDREPLVDLVHCADEPIRIPGSIQRHGFLLLLNDGGLVVGASENVEEFLGVPAGLVVGASIAALLEREILAVLRSAMDAAEGAEAQTYPGSLQTYLGSFQMRGNFYSVVTHRVGSERVLEFERQDKLVSAELTNQVFTNFLSKMSVLRTEMELCQALTEQFKELTGFNRVLLYSFDEQGHGTVLCEENDGVLPRCSGLRFPASDIPQQARDLYVVNTVRIIPDAGYEPSPMIGGGLRGTAPLDMSMSILRSVSPIHLQYMRNMGTMSSMSVSILWEGKLWGLISAHHAEPRTVPYLVRSACDLLTKFICAQLVSFRTAEDLAKMVNFQVVQRRLLTQMASEKNYVDALAGHMQELNEVTGADGVAFLKNGDCLTFGKTPCSEDLMELVGWLDEKREMEVFETRELAGEVGWASRFAAKASGMLAIRISAVRHGYILWFRPEVVQTVMWAGERLLPDGGPKQLTPRTSFESWKEMVRETSEPWSAIEIESATQFRAAVTTIGLRRAEEAVQVGEARFRELTHALPHPVWSCDDAGKLTYVNRRWRDHGFTDEGTWWNQSQIVEEDRERCSEAWASGLEVGTQFDVEVKFRLDEEDFERWNLVRATPYLRANGERAGWIGTCTDLTERRREEVALRMTEKLALTGRMTSVIAHEINNPLETLTNLLYLLAGSVEDETARSYIGLAESEVQRISGITKQTLRWSRDGTQKPEYGTAGDVFADVLRLFEGQIRNREVEVKVLGGEGVRFFGTVGQVQQVVANLLSNAVQAVPVRGRVWLEARDQGEEMEIVIGDAGAGMKAETLKNLFQPFYTTKGDLGNGLGLYISHEIVERHGGSLTVESEVGEGTVVRMRLPSSEAAMERLRMVRLGS